MALSSEGTTALLGAVDDSKHLGSAWVFTRSSTTWTQQGAKLAASSYGEIGEGLFGAGVALSAEGSTALIGAYGDGFDGVHSDVGAAWVFARSGTTWSQQGAKVHRQQRARRRRIRGQSRSRLQRRAVAGRQHRADRWSRLQRQHRRGLGLHPIGLDLDPAGKADRRAKSGAGEFGSSVALSAEGNTTYALIGGTGDHEGTGAAWVFTRSGSTWTQQGPKLTGSGEAKNGAFGESVALSGEGNTALIGGPDDNPGTGFFTDVGAAWVFTRSSSTWTQQGAKLSAGEQGSREETGEGEFGFSVALSANGNTAFVGAPRDNTGIGAAFAFTRAGSTWSQQGAKAHGQRGGVVKGEFGASVALSSEGAGALIGGPGNSERTGAAWFFARSGSTWSQQGEKITGSGESGDGGFGQAVALSAEGTTALIGGPFDNFNARRGLGVHALWLDVDPAGRKADRRRRERRRPLRQQRRALLRSHHRADRRTRRHLRRRRGVGVREHRPDRRHQASDRNRPDHGQAQRDGQPRWRRSHDECKFEYATTPSLEKPTSVPCVGLSGSGTSPIAVSAAVSGLSANTTYFFRIVAENVGGKTQGAIESFKTLFAAPTVKTEKATEVTGTSATLNATVNPNGGEVTSCKFEYGPKVPYEKSVTCTELPGSGSSPVAVSAPISSLSANTPYHFRIVATNASGAAGGTGEGADETLKTTVEAPTVKTGHAEEITQTSAKLNATVNPNGGEVTSCKFEYVTARHFEFDGYFEAHTVSCSPPPGSGTSAVPVSATVTELTANTTYHFRISATNAGGTSEGLDETFKALPFPPGAEATKTTEITQTSATLNGRVGPEGAETVCRFEYGTTLAYGSSKPCTPPPGSGEGVVSESAAISELSANTTYDFRIVAESAGGKGEGRGTFTTPCTAEGFCNNLSHFQGEASFSEPNAVAVNPSGDTYVGDSAKDQVLEFSSANKLLREFGSEGSGEGQFKGIGGIASNSAGDVYVTDVGNNRVQEFGPAGEHLRTFGSSALKSGQLLAPSGIAIDSSGDVWVLNAAGASGDRIVEFSSEGAELTRFGTNGSGADQLGQAYGLAISGGNLYVSEEANSRVQELSTAGAFVRQFDLKGSGSGESNQPYAIATEAGTGDLYVTEVGSERVQKFSPEGAFITTFGSGGSGSGQFSDPKGIALTSAGKVFVADTGNKRLQEWAAGSPPTYTTSVVHYESSEASFSEPNAVAVNPSGDIFVGDSAKDQVMEFNPERKLLRQFGSEGSGEGQFKGIGAIASNSAGDVYVTDVGNDRVQEFGPAGEHLRTFGSSALKGGQLLVPTGIAIDSSGDVWVLNAAGASGDRIVEFSSEGAELTKFGANGSAAGQLGQAYGLAISGGHLYVAEKENSRVQELSTAGAFIRQFDLKGSGSGESNQPYGIATEASTGDLYVTEVGSERVQVFSPEGAFVATFGSPGSGSGQFSGPRGIAVGSTGNVFVADTANKRVAEWLLP